MIHPTWNCISNQDRVTQHKREGKIIINKRQENKDLYTKPTYDSI